MSAAAQPMTMGQSWDLGPGLGGHNIMALVREGQSPNFRLWGGVQSRQLWSLGWQGAVVSQGVGTVVTRLLATGVPAVTFPVLGGDGSRASRQLCVRRSALVRTGALSGAKAANVHAVNSVGASCCPSPRGQLWGPSCSGLGGRVTQVTCFLHYLPGCLQFLSCTDFLLLLCCSPGLSQTYFHWFFCCYFCVGVDPSVLLSSYCNLSVYMYIHTHTHIATHAHTHTTHT